MRLSLKKLTEDGLGARAARGTAFMVLKYGGASATRLISNLILTRLLFPEAFGLMALVQVVIAAAAMFSDFGIRDAVIQDKRGSEKIFQETAWTFQVLRGLVLAAFIYMLAPSIASFFEEPRLESMLRYCAVIPIFQGFNSIGMHAANRILSLGRLTAMTLLAQLLGVIVTICLSYYLKSVWALVYGAMIGTFITTVLSHVMLPGRARLGIFEWDSARRLFGYGKYIFLATLATFFVNQGDKLVLGKFISLENLAIYNIGFFLAAVPLLIANAINDRVIFVLHARIPPTESPENKAKIDKARWYFTGALLVFIGSFAFIGDWLVSFLYDSRYHSAGPILILIALATMPRLILLSYEKLPLAFGKSNKYAAFKVGTAIAQFALTWIGVQQFGLIGAIIAPAATAIISYPFLLYMISPYNGWSPKHDVTYAALTIATIVAVLALHGTKFGALTG